eukprot:g8452.t1
MRLLPNMENENDTELEIRSLYQTQGKGNTLKCHSCKDYFASETALEFLAKYQGFNSRVLTGVPPGARPPTLQTEQGSSSSGPPPVLQNKNGNVNSDEVVPKDDEETAATASLSQNSEASETNEVTTPKKPFGEEFVGKYCVLTTPISSI